jgi:hypothetical protein
MASLTGGWTGPFNCRVLVTPAQAGVQKRSPLDSRFRGNDASRCGLAVGAPALAAFLPVSILRPWTHGDDD